MITIRQMRYFEALATTRHFRKAADMVNVSQPALSAQIAEMEDALGVKLVERSRSGTYLTEEGEALLPEVRSILSGVDRLHDRARRARSTLEGRLRLGIIPTVAPYLVPRLIPLLKAHYPDLNLEMREAVTRQCLEDLQAGRLDCALIALPADMGGIESMLLFRDHFLVASADNETDILISPLSVEEVDVERLLLLDEGHCLREQALAVCGMAAGRRVANFGATSMTTLLQMVSHGMGITLIPEIAVSDEAGRNRMRVVPMAEPQPYREIGLIWRKGSVMRRKDFQAFGEVCQRAAETLLGGRTAGQ
jgi:LysR family transcriptional regulator, hydrogen peroxide-inducible genes activator